MEAHEASELPIFELPLALVPGEHVPLHVFERRYRLMVEESMERETPFGVLLRDDEGVRAIGCSVRVAELVERHDDGRMDVIVRGLRRFRVVDRFEAADWPAAMVEEIEAATAPATGELAAARDAFRELLEAVNADPDRAAAAASADAIAAQVELPAPSKQHLLELADERERLTELEAALRTLLTRIAKQRAIAERARSNGHGGGPLGPVEPIDSED